MGGGEGFRGSPPDAYMHGYMLFVSILANNTQYLWTQAVIMQMCEVSSRGGGGGALQYENARMCVLGI